MTISLRDMLGLNNRFFVEVDGIALGAWGQCTGLEVEFGSAPVPQGGIYDYEVFLPEQIKYKVITLTRAINPTDSAQVQKWLASMVQSWMHSATGTATSGTATIKLYSADAQPVMSWQLRNVHPRKWSGPKLEASSYGIAVESLEIVHEGFL